MILDYNRSRDDDVTCECKEEEKKKKSLEIKSRHQAPSEKQGRQSPRFHQSRPESRSRRCSLLRLMSPAGVTGLYEMDQHDMPDCVELRALALDPGREPGAVSREERQSPGGTNPPVLDAARDVDSVRTAAVAVAAVAVAEAS